MRLVATVALVFFGVVASVSGSTSIVVADGDGAYPYQRWVDRAKVPTPPVTLTVVEGGCSAVDRGACTEAGTYTIWTSSIAQRPHNSFLHELGHNFDYYSLTPADRAAFLALVDAPEWRVDATPQSPHELFAETYRLCATGWRRASWEHPPLGSDAMQRACYLIRR